MKIKLNEKEFELHFGFEFLKEINNSMGVVIEVEGQEINTRTGGLTYLDAGLESYDPVSLIKAIKAGTCTLSSKPSTKDLERYVEDLLVTNTDEYVQLVEELKEEIKKQPMLTALSRVQANLG